MIRHAWRMVGIPMILNEKHGSYHIESVDSDYQKFREITLGLKENSTHWLDKAVIYSYEH